ncbi:MAG: CPBP family intramembrane metalloprotease [Candidatus Marsarchaeota archaeon]|jgi:membrane protease YdiL (CAAX protease family)|nr:CPBP family intramembrane metalloprotease [Candidatus Marsarchaeota archaeon]
MKMNKLDYVYFLLPLILWPLTFIVFSNYFVYAMSVSTVILAAISILRYRDRIFFASKKHADILLYGAMGAVALYALFVAGYYLALFTGNVAYVKDVYTLIYSQAQTILLVVLLAIIGICEELYWRGGIQGFIKKNSKVFRNMPWVASSLFYTAVHISTLNPILVIAALFVGVVTSIIADKYGIAASAIAHVAWIEAIIVFLPVLAI